ncbi:unnamed protein product, partial [marine sediment metagenome]
MKKIAFLLVFVAVFWGCQTFSPSYKSGTEAAINKDWDEAVKHYERAVLGDPKNSVYRLALMRARVAAGYDHLYKARQLAAENKKEEALREYDMALTYDPASKVIAE